jgi:hypothetical protein
MAQKQHYGLPVQANQLGSKTMNRLETIANAQKKTRVRDAIFACFVALAAIVTVTTVTTATSTANTHVAQR